MPRTKLGYCAASPLFRHPSLLWRKVHDRTVGPSRFDFEKPPGGRLLSYPDVLASTLRAWAATCRLNDRHLASQELFRQDFDRGELLKLCKTGPLPRNDLHGDIKLIWEFSRGYAYSVNAVRGLANANDIAGEIGEWIECNADPDGPNWTNPMEIAIRAVNWICADALMEGRISAALGKDVWISNLWNSGRAIFQRLEVRLVCSNHYLANLLGLLVIGTVLNHPEWRDFALHEFPRALATQTYGDGGVYEASLPYHALVTEMALLFALFSGIHIPRLPAMCQVLADTCDVDGDVFQVGDNDGGRIIPLDFVSSLGRAQILLNLARVILGQSAEPRDSALFPESGWWTFRNESWTVLFEFGGVGLAGRGGHAHNDDLSVCVNWRDQRVFVDPGTYLYTPDPASRNEFRSARSHNSMVINGSEPRPMPQRDTHDLFFLPGPIRAARISSSGRKAAACGEPLIGRRASARPTATPETLTVTRREKGGISHQRTLRVELGHIEIQDRITGSEEAQLSWAFHLMPGVQGSISGNSVSFGEFLLECPAPPRLENYEYSPFYGQRVKATRIVADLKTSLPADVYWKLQRT